MASHSAGAASVNYGMHLAINSHLVEIHLLPIPVLDKPIQVLLNKWPGLVTYDWGSTVSKGATRWWRDLPVDAFWAKNGNMWMLIESMASRTFCAPPFS